MNESIPICCDGMRVLRSNYFEDGILRPLIGGSFESSSIYFCPSCGVNLKDKAMDTGPGCLKSDNLNFCCQRMESFATPDDSHSNDDFEIFYQPWVRRFFFSISTYARVDEPENKIYKEWDFYYCPWCGAKFPRALLNEWLEIIQQKFGVEKQLPFEKMLSLVPEEFRTEEWWRNRGL